MKKLSFLEKAGYGLGDAASNFFFQVSIFYLAFFYTDIFGISPAAMGTMFLVVRIFDTVNDPLMGVIADRTNTRWGKFRPWMLWGSLPFGLIFIAMFSTPDLGPAGKLVYAYITYTAMLMVYTVTNVPYSALMGVMTPDPQERTRISTFRFAGAFGAGLLVQYATLNLVAIFSGGTDALLESGASYYNTAERVIAFAEAETDKSAEWMSVAEAHKSWLELIKGETEIANEDLSRQIFMETLGLVKSIDSVLRKSTGNFAEFLSEAQVEADALLADFRAKRSKGYQWTMSIFGILATIFWIVSFATTRERVKPSPSQVSSLKEDLLSLAHNSPWIVVSIVSMFMLVFVVVRGGSTLYFFKYSLESESAAPVFLVASGLFVLSGALVAPYFVNWFGKRTVLLACLLILSGFYALTYLIQPGDWILLWIVTIGGSIPGGVQAVVQWAIFADTADYGEWKTGRRNTGLIFSSALFALKTGITIGGAVLGWYLSFIGFEADAVQSTSAAQGLRVLHTLLPAGLAIIGFVLMLAYPLREDKVQEIADELEQRRGH